MRSESGQDSRNHRFTLKKGKTAPLTTTNFEDILNDDEIDAVVIMTDWNTHVNLAKASLLAGKYTAVEVGCAYSLQECYDLIEAYETTKAPLMMLENCCYGRTEMMALNLAKQGLFGEIVHCKGGYHHYLPSVELFVEGEYNHYRIQEYIHRNCEQYPTHELGPISKVLGINRGNRMMKLVSVASKSRALKEYAAKFLPEDSEYNHVEYKQGDIVNTCIKGEEEGHTNNRDESYEKHDHPLHKEYTQSTVKGGHGGMDWLVCRAFVESVKAGINTPIDAYDTVSWMAIAPLSEMSIQKGGMPVDIPDFTRGKWIRREPAPKNKYCLDEVVADPDTPIFPD